ncbi:hypothetical protein TcCL_NonESM08163 [Trypanosoma cruzi]|nr:hypothetical protein TcCL_NonESM08163 [Trypanosoma cruzi]
MTRKKKKKVKKKNEIKNAQLFILSREKRDPFSVYRLGISVDAKAILVQKRRANCWELNDCVITRALDAQIAADELSTERRTLLMVSGRVLKAILESSVFLLCSSTVRT